MTTRPTGYHAHIYFLDDDQRAATLALLEAIAARFPQARIGRVHDRPVAFHPAPMVQVAFPPEHLAAVLPWLMARRGALSVLVHPLIGDVVRAHTTDAVWLGAPLALDRSILDRVGRAQVRETAAASAPSAGRTILRIDASMRRDGSVGRQLADRVVTHLAGQLPDAAVLRRDLADGVPLLDPDRLQAWWTAEAERSPVQHALMDPSDTLIAELEAADAVVIAAPLYNFGPPAALKAWFDLVARAGRTFDYTPTGPVGRLADRPVYVVVTTGGVPVDAPVDFLTPWLRQALHFIGIDDVRVLAADRLVAGGEARRAEVDAALDQLLQADAAAA